MTFLNGGTELSRSSADMKKNTSAVIDKLEGSKELVKPLTKLMRFGARLYVGSFTAPEAFASASKPKYMSGLQKQPNNQTADAPAHELEKVYEETLQKEAGPSPGKRCGGAIRETAT